MLIEVLLLLSIGTSLSVDHSAQCNEVNSSHLMVCAPPLLGNHIQSWHSPRTNKGATLGILDRDTSKDMYQPHAHNMIQALVEPYSQGDVMMHTWLCPRTTRTGCR